jgi:PAS domain S-box-containing protein
MIRKTRSGDFEAGIGTSKLSDAVSTRYRLLWERSSDIIWFTRPDGSFVDVNQAAIDTYGYSRREFLRMNVRDIRHHSSLNELQEQLRSAIDNTHFETLHVRKDGSTLPVEVKANGADFDGERLIMAIVRDISERRKSEIALRESEERRKLAQEAGHVGIFDWDVAAGKTYWSETMWSFYGEEQSDINPDEDFWSSHLHINDRERVKLNIHQVISSGDDTFRDEFRIVRKDGTTRWIGAVAKVTRDESGAAIRMSGVNMDITERKQAEERIRLSENQLRLVTGAVPALISYVDKDERYRYVNTKFTEWLGTPTAEIVGRKVRDVVGARIYRVLKPHIDRALSGEEVSFEALLTYSKIGDRNVHASYVPDIGVDGSVHGYYGLTHDLTDLKRSEARLRSSEARIGLLTESFTDYAIFSLNADGKIDTWSKGAENIFGYRQDEVIGQPCDIFFRPEDREDGIPRKVMNTARRRGKASDERWLLRKNGTTFFSGGVTMPLYEGDLVTGYAKIASDLTEKKRIAEELQRSHDRLEQRVSERTAELAKTNLALIEEMAEREVAEKQRIDLLRRLVNSQEMERRRIARDIHDQLGQRLTALRLKVASLKEFAIDNKQFSDRVERLQEIAERLDSEVSFLAWELRPTTLDDLGLVDAVRAFVDEWSRHCEIEADFHSTSLQGDRMSPEMETHLYRITQEALNNIAKYANANHVSVLLEKRDGNVILIVEDDGSGFDPEAESNSEVSKGLGLIGMRERAALVGGDIEIESAPGRGTAIYVRVPLYL